MADEVLVTDQDVRAAKLVLRLHVGLGIQSDNVLHAIAEASEIVDAPSEPTELFSHRAREAQRMKRAADDGLAEAKYRLALRSELREMLNGERLALFEAVHGDPDPSKIAALMAEITEGDRRPRLELLTMLLEGQEDGLSEEARAALKRMFENLRYDDPPSNLDQSGGEEVPSTADSKPTEQD